MKVPLKYTLSSHQAERVRRRCFSSFIGGLVVGHFHGVLWALFLITFMGCGQDAYPKPPFEEGFYNMVITCTYDRDNPLPDPQSVVIELAEHDKRWGMLPYYLGGEIGKDGLLRMESTVGKCSKGAYLGMRLKYNSVVEVGETEEDRATVPGFTGEAWTFDCTDNSIIQAKTVGAKIIRAPYEPCL